MEGGRGCVSERVHAAADLNLNIAHPAMFLKFTAGLGRDGSCDVTTIARSASSRSRVSNASCLIDGRHCGTIACDSGFE